MPLFIERDRAIIEAQSSDPKAEPSFELLKGCLVWADEHPNGLTPDGYSTLCDLWGARGYLHRGRPMPEHLRAIWEEAQSEGLRWIGFRRLTLSAEEKEYYEAALHDAASADDW